MTKHYCYRLGIDIGIASIGAALVKLDATKLHESNEAVPLGIIDLGVRTFTVAEGATERRDKRLGRKRLRRRTQRLKGLARILQEHELLPADKDELSALMRLSPYRLRAHGMRHKFSSPHELGRCLLHIAKFRGAGFLNELEESTEDAETNTAQASSQTSPKKSKKDTQKTAKAYRGLEDRLKNTGESLSEFFRERIKDKKPTRRRADFIAENLIDYAVPRFLVKEDLKRLWEAQQRFYSDQLSDSLYQKVYEAIFKDSPRAPYAFGKCTLNPDSGENRLPKMHRLAELRRIYEQINHMRLNTAAGSEELTKPMRDKLVEVVMSGQSLSKTAVTKLLKDMCETRILSVNLGEDEKAIKAFAQVKAFADLSYWHGLSEQEQDEIIEFIAEPRLKPEDDNSSLMSEEDMLEWLRERLKLGDEKEGKRKAADIVHNLPQGRSNLGKSACKAILAKLIEGQVDEKGENGETGKWRPHSHRSAADACDYLAEEEKHRAMAGSFDNLPYYGQVLQHDVAPVHPWHEKTASAEEATYGRIPNPVVHVALNQLRKMVNEIIKLYGKPQSIVVELARDFGKSKKQRKEIEKRQKKLKKDNERIDEELKTFKLKPNGKNRLKYKLWEEQGCRDIYTLETIQCTDLEECEIDHIIPRQAGGSDSYMNKCLTKRANAAKSDTFAYDFIQSHCPDTYQHIEKLIGDKKNYPEQKAWRFRSDAKERFTVQGDEDATDSRLNNTSYIAKMSKRYLSVLTGDITVVRGSMTAQLRHLWGLDGLEYELFGQTGEELKNPQWQGKPRIDHRHHALDALVAACTTRRMVQVMATHEKLGKQAPAFPVPFAEHGGAFRELALQSMRQVRVSPKPEHGAEGQLHDDTAYGILRPKSKSKADNDYLIRYKRKLDNLDTKAKISDMMFTTNTIPLDDEITREIHAQTSLQIESIEARYAEAEHQLEEERQAALQEGRKAWAVTEKHIVQRAVKLAKRQDKRVGNYFTDLKHKKLVAVRPSLKCGYEPKNNFCVDFYEDSHKGTVGWECITRFHNAQIPSGGFEPQWKKDGQRLLWRVYKDDVLELDFDAESIERFKFRQAGLSLAPGRHLVVVQKFSDDKLQFNLLHDARALGGKEGPSRWVSGGCGLIIFTKAQARKIELSPFGKMLRKHKKLWHGKKTKEG